MFIQDLSVEQQQVFLFLARKVIEADGVLHELQLVALAKSLTPTTPNTPRF
ncbi:hypothetical protein NHP190003_10130 [Helicobacter sp. NHP19-003]|uniref:MarR family transcriptional regulator n=1 Tax=Helicobacter gastrocanis TaxID=2849641 RepID=A0ABM7SAS7_9HELI|nr:hypothetical protein [Helicobacter sp. NHP19-003]BCZ17731.1 hypothetical protein NHP190003_10130 [Helicobacter sp. NHP19-003]